MLSALTTECRQECTSQSVPVDFHNNWKRNEREDMKLAIEYLYEFKKKLSDLHPNCLSLIENMLQHRRF